ncbi:MAG TPA: SpoIIE family protein phosphatase [Anaerolineaceae bacterium]|nr:SpoIIE family protein phosphatase [Anaerolineaceae bacterium]
MSSVRSIFQRTWRSLTHSGESPESHPAPSLAVDDRVRQSRAVEVDIPANDPLLAYFLTTSGAVDVDRLDLESPTLAKLKEAGFKITLPLISQGELIGLLNLGPRLSEQEYSTDDHRLLHNLSIQAAPALRVAQLARQQQAEALALERLEQEMRVARIIQQTLLPKELPSIPGWQVKAHWQPARAVSGDFYDFIYFPDGRLGLVIGDVTDKGVPAALVMATTRSILRAVAERLGSPSEVLGEVNNLLCPDIPHNMFVTCLYAILDPSSGRFQFANAGHNLPSLCDWRGVSELQATGMPLGLLEDMEYRQEEVTLTPGARLVLYSDGLVEAHNPQGAMFGFPRLHAELECLSENQPLIALLLQKLEEFTGSDWEQEDDVTFVTLEYREKHVNNPDQTQKSNQAAQDTSPGDGEPIEWKTLADFDVPSQPGNERLAMNQVASAVQELSLEVSRLERLKTAVAEATMNGMEHGNKYRPDLVVHISVAQAPGLLSVQISDHGGDQPIPHTEVPNLEAKLEGKQSPRGWGLFLIENMVDEMHVTADETHHTVELIMKLNGGQDDNKTV